MMATTIINSMSVKPFWMDWRIGLYLPWISIFNQTEKRLLEAPFGIPCRELSNFRTNSLGINPYWVSPRNFLMQVAVLKPSHGPRLGW